MSFVLDSSALIAFLRDEPGGAVVGDILLEAISECVVHAVNLCEVYYDTRRVSGEDAAQLGLHQLALTGLGVNEELDRSLWLVAGQLKADLRRISIADCFCAALANRLGGEVLTCDREFEKIADRGFCRVRFIR